MDLVTRIGTRQYPHTNHKWYGSGFFNQERACNNEDEYRSSKLAKNDEFPGSKPLMFHQRNALLRSSTSLFFDEQEEQQMLSFSAPKSDAISVDRNSKKLTFPHFHLQGYNNGEFNGANMHWDGELFNLGSRATLIQSQEGVRRTDGKKWQCSRDAVADQKYCERHMNRDCNRSRKPVEGQSGHSVASTATNLMPNVFSSTSAAGPVGGSNKPNSVTIARQQSENLQPGGASSLSAEDPLNRSILNKGSVGENMPHTAPGLSMISPNGDLKSRENPFLNPKQPLNLSHKSSSIIECRNFGSSQDLTSQETESQHSFRRFIDDKPKRQSDYSIISLPELDVQSYRIQLSISIPMAASDFMSTTSSPNNRNLTLPLWLSREFNPIHIRLGVGNVTNESNQRQINWTPVSWETSMEGSDNSPRIGSSPTGVLQKTTFGSLSNSSAGSSPRTENNKTHEGVTHLNNLLGSTPVESSSLPALTADQSLAMVCSLVLWIKRGNIGNRKWMKSKEHSRKSSNKFVRFLKAPFKALRKARDGYIRILTSCASSMHYGQCAIHFPGQFYELPTSFGERSSATSDVKEEAVLRELASSSRRWTQTEMFSSKQMRMKTRSRGLPKNMGRIDEDKPCEFEDNDVVNVDRRRKFGRVQRKNSAMLDSDDDNCSVISSSTVRSDQISLSGTEEAVFYKDSLLDAAVGVRLEGKVINAAFSFNLPIAICYNTSSVSELYQERVQQRDTLASRTVARDLSVEAGGKGSSKKDINNQRSLFKDVLEFLEYGYSPETSMKIGEDTLHTSTRSKLIQNNEFLQDVFGFTAKRRNLVADEHISNFGKRMYKSPNSVANKARTQQLNKQRMLSEGGNFGYFAI
ncbi:putative Ribosomal RNA processing protein 1 B [Hibiscus syriacus]|uniref:Ribosomal RNA processing protein 1 B n=1 Tax=Hibiscus syriacus TaxID=106335 RepID=A0A6A2YS78_HIBSY|nr:putative Ribosomal RNA processing protein 1 B [Hibiscus syriacus]